MSKVFLAFGDSDLAFPGKNAHRRPGKAEYYETPLTGSSLYLRARSGLVERVQTKTSRRGAGATDGRSCQRHTVQCAHFP